MEVPISFPESRPTKLGDNGTPWWVRAIYMLGVPAAIAVFLIYFVTTAVSSEIGALQEELRAHRREQAALIFYLQAICRNSAQTDMQRAACEPPR